MFLCYYLFSLRFMSYAICLDDPNLVVVVLVVVPAKRLVGMTGILHLSGDFSGKIVSKMTYFC